MAKWWLTDKQSETADVCLQMFGGYGYMEEYPISQMYVDSRVQRIYGGTNEIMKMLIARHLWVGWYQKLRTSLSEIVFIANRTLFCL